MSKYVIKKICCLFLITSFLLNFEIISNANSGSILNPNGYNNMEQFDWMNTPHWNIIDGMFYLIEPNGEICTDVRKYFKTFPSYKINVNRKQNVVTVYALDINQQYNLPVCSFLCSCGGDTPIGNFLLNGQKQKWGLMFDGTYCKWTTRIVDHILFHSIPYTSQDSNTIIREDYNGLGVLQSAGCVRLQAKDAYWIYKNINKNTLIHIYDSDEKEPFPIPTLERQLEENEFFDPTDPDIINKK